MLRPLCAFIRRNDAAIGNGANAEQNGDGYSESELHRAKRLHLHFHLGHPRRESGSSSQALKHAGAAMGGQPGCFELSRELRGAFCTTAGSLAAPDTALLAMTSPASRSILSAAALTSGKPNMAPAPRIEWATRCTSLSDD
jgi:hypothetical protein